MSVVGHSTINIGGSTCTKDNIAVGDTNTSISGVSISFKAFIFGYTWGCVIAIFKQTAVLHSFRGVIVAVD
jgi:hypothetical protein